ncbi:hypothetical protein DSL92_04025 [Billgrantia gudaonensis]|uniref:Uncharacterized protein n=1 Tax=Billgrantia gudaonensis TaxID=376427 RepID=A0A3S0NEZ4_9GAMM|nr:hypothetical protein DSL92_04025 [Halomonas gudaonensis]
MYRVGPIRPREPSTSEGDPGQRRAATPGRRQCFTLSITREVRQRVHTLSSALLVLDDETVAVKHLDGDRVAVHVTLVDADTDTARVAGLPERVRLITLGGGFAAGGRSSFGRGVATAVKEQVFYAHPDRGRAGSLADHAAADDGC